MRRANANKGLEIDRQFLKLLKSSSDYNWSHTMPNKSYLWLNFFQIDFAKKLFDLFSNFQSHALYTLTHTALI
jgi:hypothetical protein